VFHLPPASYSCKNPDVTYHLCNAFVTFEKMRDIEITPECLEFIDDQDQRVREKFFQLIEVIGELRIIHSNFLKKLMSTDF
jgi:hypothetical protein